MYDLRTIKEMNKKAAGKAYYDGASTTEVNYDFSLSEILNSSDKDVRVVRRQDGSIAMGALTKKGMREMAACSKSGVYEQDHKHNVESYWFGDFECYMIILWPINDK
jgi:hypothetical protein